jgi:hypothetical protein
VPRPLCVWVCVRAIHGRAREGQYKLSVEFSAKLRTDLRGLYLSTYVGPWAQMSARPSCDTPLVLTARSCAVPLADTFNVTRKLAVTVRCVSVIRGGPPSVTERVAGGWTQQMEPTDARRVFPCLDEPAHKASFSLSVEAPIGYSVLSNTPAVDNTTINGVRQVRARVALSLYLSHTHTLTHAHVDAGRPFALRPHPS